MRNFLTGVIVFGVILISIWLQLNLFNNIPLLGVKANIGIVLVVTLSTLCGQGIGISVGITYGMLSDILFGKAFGIYTFLYFLIGFFCGKISKGFSKENRTAIVMITIATTIIYEIISYFIFMIIFDYDVEVISMIRIVLFEGIYNILIARLFYKFFSNLSETINKGKRSYYLL